jgi:hypothetical protein
LIRYAQSDEDVTEDCDGGGDDDDDNNNDDDDDDDGDERIFLNSIHTLRCSWW